MLAQKVSFDWRFPTGRVIASWTRKRFFSSMNQVMPIESRKIRKGLVANLAIEFGNSPFPHHSILKIDLLFWNIYFWMLAQNMPLEGKLYTSRKTACRAWKRPFSSVSSDVPFQFRRTSKPLVAILAIYSSSESVQLSHLQRYPTLGWIALMNDSIVYLKARKTPEDFVAEITRPTRDLKRFHGILFRNQDGFSKHVFLRHHWF